MMVIGIDSHKDVLMGCLINNKTRPVEYRSVQNTPRGHSEVVSWVRSCGAGRVAVEGSGNYGRPLAQALAGAGFNVVEMPPQMTAHARKGAAHQYQERPHRWGLSNRLCEGVGSWVFSGLGLVGWGSGFRVGLGLFSSRGCRCRGFLLVCWLCFGRRGPAALELIGRWGNAPWFW